MPVAKKKKIFRRCAVEFPPPGTDYHATQQAHDIRRGCACEARCACDAALSRFIAWRRKCGAVRSAGESVSAVRIRQVVRKRHKHPRAVRIRTNGSRRQPAPHFNTSTARQRLRYRRRSRSDGFDAFCACSRLPSVLAALRRVAAHA